MEMTQDQIVVVRSALVSHADKLRKEREMLRGHCGGNQDNLISNLDVRILAEMDILDSLMEHFAAIVL